MDEIIGWLQWKVFVYWPTRLRMSDYKPRCR